MKEITIMIPTFNEEENIIPIYCEIVKMFKDKLWGYRYKILFIDNKSTDSTRLLIRNLCNDDKNVCAILNARNAGFLNSTYYGLINTTSDCTIMLFADFQDPIELIPRMVQEWEKGFEVVCCVKNKSYENKLLYAARSIYYRLIKAMSDVNHIEHFTGFGLYDKHFIKIMRELEDPTPFLRGIVAELATNYTIIEYQQNKRRAGKSKFSLYKLYDVAMVAFTSYTKVGLRIATFFGFFMSIAGLLVSLLYLILKLCLWDMFPGGAIPVLIGVFGLGSVQLFFIGLLGEYVLSINARLMKRPLVIEEKRINFDI